MLFSAADVHYRVCWSIICLLSSAIILGNVLEGMRSLTILGIVPYHDWGQRCGTLGPVTSHDRGIAGDVCYNNICELLGAYLSHLISLAKALSSEGGCGNVLSILGATTSVHAAAYRCLFKMCIFSMSIIGMMFNAGRHFV